MNFIEKIKEQVKSDRKKIVLPESMDERTFEAAEKILKEGIADIIIIGTKDLIEKYGKGYDISGATIIDPDTDINKQKYIDTFVELRKSKGITEEEADRIIHEDYMYYAVLMCKCGDADGVVSGACHTTANTIRPCLQIIKTKPGVKLVSTLFIMEVQDKSYGSDGLFLFSDCALNTSPNAEELAIIAGTSGYSFKEIIGEEPKIAMLSYSTKGSANQEDVLKIQEATAIAQANYPELKIDGEFQLDSAIVPEVAGHANVLIFPDLNSGNIGYKLVQRLGGANAYGPLLQGIAMPVNDLSRGCSADDIVGVVALTALQAQHSGN